MQIAKSSSARGSTTYGLHLLIAALPFTDFLQIGLVAFGAAPIMGDLGAGPEEYSLVTTTYAMVAIGVICIHRWLVEAIGWRRLIMASAGSLALGALICSTSESLIQFGCGRATMALGCASFLTAGRVLVNHIPVPQQRFIGVKFFAAGLAWGLVAGPLVAAMALATYGWRAAFVALLVPACVVFVIGNSALSDERPERSRLAVRSSLIGLAILLLGGFALLYGVQRSAFNYFDKPARMWICIAVCIAAMAMFIVIQGRTQGRRLIEVGLLKRERYVIGLALFSLAYLLLGANNAMLPVLLQRAFGVPLEIVCRILAVGGLGSVVTWIVLSRLLPKSGGPLRYYMVGTCCLLLCGVQLSGLSESSHPWLSVIPALLCNGAFVILILATTAMYTFQSVPQDEISFSHANQMKNVLAQFCIAAGSLLSTVCLQWRGSLRYTRLVERLADSEQAVSAALEALTRQYAAGGDPGAAPRLALARVGQIVLEEATFMATLDYFSMIAVFAAVCALLVVAQALRMGFAERRLSSRF